MTAPADPQLLLDQAVSRLTGPGGPFEIVEEEVLGTVMPVMKNRGHAIGELISHLAPGATATISSPAIVESRSPSMPIPLPRWQLLCGTSTESARATVWASSLPTLPNGS